MDQTRNFAGEEGWDELSDRYFKAGEISISDSPFPIKEARNYGYED